MASPTWYCIHLAWLVLISVSSATYLGRRSSSGSYNRFGQQGYAQRTGTGAQNFRGRPGGGVYHRGANQTRHSLNYPRKPENYGRTYAPPVGVKMLGPVCTSLGRRCLSTARCLYREQRCQCSSVMPVGDGHMECTSQGNMICKVDCDPKVYTWKHAKAPINLPCWYRVTRFIIPIYPQPNYSIYKWCLVQVRVLNTLTDKSLFFVGTVVVDVWITGLDTGKFYLHDDSLKRYEVTYLTARQSVRTQKDPWTVWLKQPSFYDQAAMKKTFPDKFPIITSWDSADRFAVLRIPQCNVQVKYRPFTETQPQILKPGVVVTAPHNNLVRFKRPYFSSVCLTPGNSSSTYWSDAIRWKLKNPAQVALLYVLLQRDLRTSQTKNPKYHIECVTSRYILQNKYCQSDRYLAIRLCGPLLNLRRRFIKCLGPTEVLKVFVKCVSWACYGESGGKLPACQSYLQALQDKGCPPTSLMNAIGCHDNKRKHYRDHVFNPSPRIETILGY